MAETREGWATTPSGRKLEDEKPPKDRVGTISDGLAATPERIALARSTWTEASAEDYERIDSRTFRDGSEVEWKRLSGNPLLGAGVVRAGASEVFIVAAGRLVFLRRAGDEPGEIRRMGSTGGRRARLSDPMPGTPVIR